MIFIKFIPNLCSDTDTNLNIFISIIINIKSHILLLPLAKSTPNTDITILKISSWFETYIIIMKLVLVIGLLLVSASSILTSKDFERKGFNVKDGIYDQANVLDVRTQCKDVLLNKDPYNYTHVVQSGYLNVGSQKGSSALAFIFYGKEGASKQQLKNYPTLIWLNGGPGSSSQIGNFMQLGPFWIKRSEDHPWKIEKNENSWTKEYNILFVDQPVGTGLSYADPRVTDPFVKNMDDVANDFYNALNEMYNSDSGCFKSLGITGDHNLFIFGQSYAGKYVPAISLKIVQEKQKGGFLTGLRGSAIGDGFTHPYFILAEIGGFAYNVGLIDYQERAKIEQLILNATFQNKYHQYNDLHDSFEVILDNIVEWSGGVNVYDFTKYERYPTQLLEEFFWHPDTKTLFNLSPEISYGQQSANVYQALYTDFMKSEVERVQTLLGKDFPFLIYNGQNDIIVENPGTMRWVDSMFFPNANEFKDTLFSLWKVNGKMAGYQKKVGKLDFRIVNNAGHLVPMDQGVNALAMVKDFVNANKK